MKITEKKMQSKMILIEQANEMLILKKDKVELAREKTERAKEKVELEKRMEKREQMLYEGGIIRIDTTNMDELKAEYYKALIIKTNVPIP